MSEQPVTLSYRLCRAGSDLRAEIDAAYPRRDRTSDGWVGDTSHARRRSDHNPDERGVVKAVDIDEDGIPGFDAIVERIRLLGMNGDARLAGGYIIRNGWIAGSHTSWAKHRYTGPNPHDKHAHFSFADSPSGYDKLGDWPVEPKAVPKPAPSPVIPGVHEHRTATISRLDVGHPQEIKDLQGHLNAWRFNRDLSEHEIDGRWDAWLEVSWRTFQRTYGLEEDGVCGPEGWRMVHKVTKGARRG